MKAIIATVLAFGFVSFAHASTGIAPTAKLISFEKLVTQPLAPVRATQATQSVGFAAETPNCNPRGWSCHIEDSGMCCSHTCNHGICQ